MKSRCLFRRHRSEAGVALLISIFVLLLICVVGIALMVASGTESALAGNYRSATGVYYAALAGLEEGRGRLLPRNLNYFNKTQANFMPPSGTALAYADVRYITNPVGGEDVLTDYPDTEYKTEFSANPPGTPPPVNSVSTVAGILGPIYKWVRINAVSEKSLKLDVNGNGSGDQTESLFYDGSHLNHNPASGFPAFEITALAALPKPNGSQKLLQYVVAPVQLNLSLSAALTMAGTTSVFSGPNSSSFFIDGNDQASPTCGPQNLVPAIGVINDTDRSNIASGQPPDKLPHPSNYKGSVPPPPASPPPTPSVINISSSVPANFFMPDILNNTLVQNIRQNADAVVPGPATQSNFPSAMSASNPMTIVVDGDLNLSGNFTGYGLLLVTGDFKYTGDSGWQGIVLVIGKGDVATTGAGGNEFDGAVFVAKTLDGSGKPLPTLGVASYDLSSNPGGNGIHYNSCLVKKALPIISYQALSFHEIPIPQP